MAQAHGNAAFKGISPHFCFLCSLQVLDKPSFPSVVAGLLRPTTLTCQEVNDLAAVPVVLPKGPPLNSRKLRRDW